MQCIQQTLSLHAPLYAHPLGSCPNLLRTYTKALSEASIEGASYSFAVSVDDSSDGCRVLTYVCNRRNVNIKMRIGNGSRNFLQQQQQTLKNSDKSTELKGTAPARLNSVPPLPECKHFIFKLSKDVVDSNHLNDAGMNVLDFIFLSKNSTDCKSF